MKYILLSLTFLAASASCSAMETEVTRKLKDYNTAERRLELKIGSKKLTLNGKKTSYFDEKFFDVLDSIVSLAEEQYSFLESAWKEKKGSQENGWYDNLAHYCLESMKFLKERFMRQLYDKYPIQDAFSGQKVYGHDFFVKVLNLFEKFHDLRIEVCREWKKEYNPQLVSKVYLGEAFERYFQNYANVLKANVTVKDWYERMRKNDI